MVLRDEKERRKQAKKDIGEDDSDCRDPKKQRIMAREKGRKHPRDEAAEEVAKSRQTAEEEEDEMSSLVASDHDGFSDSDEENDE